MEKEVRRQQTGKVGCFPRVSGIRASALGGDSHRGWARAGASATTLTFIMSTTVFKAIMAMMVYSKDGDTTKCHTRYWKVCLFCGM